jgi:hypothetical protein
VFPGQGCRFGFKFLGVYSPFFVLFSPRVVYFPLIFVSTGWGKVHPDLLQMLGQLPRMAAPHKGDGQIGYVRRGPGLHGEVEAGVGVDLVKILNRNIVRGS